MISIIIIVKNDPRIEVLLNKLRTISSTNKFEIIVVDASNGSLKTIEKKFPEAQWIQFINKSSKTRTFSEQRNIGVKKARGDIIVFVDADCIPSKNWLDDLTKPIIYGKEYIVSGSVRPLKKDFVHIEEQYAEYRNECETMNIAIAKKVFRDIGYFDETLEGCEDSDFCIRARNKEYRIKFEKRAVVYHDWGGVRKNIIRSYNGGRDRINLYNKHLKHLLVLNSYNIYTLFYVLYIIFIPLYIFFPILSLVVFLPSIIKRRNPIKELYNLSFALGTIRQLFVKLL